MIAYENMNQQNYKPSKSLEKFIQNLQEKSKVVVHENSNLVEPKSLFREKQRIS